MTMTVNEIETMEIVVCTDCYFSHHEGRFIPGTWTLLESNEYVVDQTTCAPCWDANLECEHNTQDFSADPCGGCGTQLAGERYQMAILEN